MNLPTLQTVINSTISQQRLNFLLLVWVYGSDKAGSKTEAQNNLGRRGPPELSFQLPGLSRSGHSRQLRAVSKGVKIDHKYWILCSNTKKINYKMA